MKKNLLMLDSSSFPARLKRLIFNLLFAFLATQAFAQPCPGDTEPPQVFCLNGLSVNLMPTGFVTLWPQDFLANVSDNCTDHTNIVLRVKRQNDGPCDSDTQPDDFAESLVLCCAEAGQTIGVVLRAIDTNGNFSDCQTTVVLNDAMNPTCIPPSNLTLSCADFDIKNLAPHGTATGTDNCAVNQIVESVDSSDFSPICSTGLVLRTFTVSDASGNSSTCTQRITVSHASDFFIRFPNDTLADLNLPFLDLGEPQILNRGCELIGMSYEDVVQQLPNGDLAMTRTWTIIDWCNYDPNLPITEVPNPNPEADPAHPANRVGPTVSTPGTPGWEPTEAALTPGSPVVNFSTFWSPTPTGYRYTQLVNQSSPPTFVFSGKIFSDASTNCAFETGEQKLAFWNLKFTGTPSGNVHFTTSDGAGNFTLGVNSTDTAFTVELVTAENFTQNCPLSQVINTPAPGNYTLDVPVNLNSECPVLWVDVAAARMRRCFNNNYYVRYANLSDQAVPSARIEIQLDENQILTTSGIALTDLGNNRYQATLGDLQAGRSGSFFVQILLDCDAPLGATHCAEAWIFPDTLCGNQGLWSGANIVAEAECDGDSVRMILKNTGAGPMQQALEYIVVEDVILYRDAPFQLAPNEVMALAALPADGTTWRLESPQEPGHPFGGTVSATIEGCGGINTPGLVNTFVVSNPNPFYSIDCQENTGSFDPNEMRVSPKGYGTQRFVERNTDLEYLVLFQNVGTDTAFTVAILDTLPAVLDVTSVQPGASSHSYSFQSLGGNAVRFLFENINLPDSTTNLDGSQGFVKFRIAQQPDNALGTRIENRAGIYFDFNDPVITNEAWLTIGEKFIFVAVDNPDKGFERLKVYPNPAPGEVFFEMPEASEQAVFSLTDAFGKAVFEKNFSGKVLRLEGLNLQEGVYFFKIKTDGGRAFSGKVMLK